MCAIYYTDSQKDPCIGDCIGNYVLDSLIENTMNSIIYSCTNITTKKSYAIKMVKIWESALKRVEEET